MSLDLLLGRLRRDWGCGLVTPGDLRDLQDSEAVQALGEQVAAEVRATYDLVVRLTAEKRLPDDARRSYAPFMRRWLEWSQPRQGKYGAADHLALTNFRSLNQQHRARISTLATAAPAALAPSQEQEQPRGPSIAGYLLGAGLGLGILYLRNTIRRKS